MRRFLSGLAVLALLAGGSATAYARSRVHYHDGQGDMDTWDDFRRVIRVRNTDTAATTLGNGDVVIWDIRSATNTSLENRWSVTTTTIANDPRVAGVVVGTEAVGNTGTIAPNAYGYLQTYGIHTAVKTLGQVNEESAGLTTSTTRGRAQAATGAGGSGSATSGGSGNFADPLSEGDGTTTITAFVRR